MAKAPASRLNFRPQAGMRPSLEFRPLSSLAVDPSYQRSINAESSQALIRRIATGWDWSLCQPLAVARREDGSLRVVDGQHRLEAAKLRGDIYDLPCVVTSYPNAGAEAAAFVALNQQRRPLSKMDLFKAALAAADDVASEVMQIISQAGLSLAPHSNYTAWKPGMINNISAVQTCHRVHGEKVTRAALAALAQGFKGQVLQYAGTIFPGIYLFVADEVRVEGGADVVRIADTLASASQKEWVREIGVECALLGVRRQQVAKLLIARSYKERRLTPAPEPAPAPASTPQLVAVAPGARPVTAYHPDEVTIFCDQCDRRVSGAEANGCRSRFCKAKAA